MYNKNKLTISGIKKGVKKAARGAKAVVGMSINLGKAFARNATGGDARALIKEWGMDSKKKKKNWIKGAIKKPGALRKSLGVKKGQKIPAKKLAKAAQKGGKLGQRARLAETLRKMK